MGYNTRKYITVFASAAAAALLSHAAFAASAKGSVHKGNVLYEKEDFKNALEKYNDALGRMPDSDVANYNAGLAHYRLGDYVKAEQTFTKALVSEDKALEEKALYNIGNLKYRQGEKIVGSDPEGTVRFYKESLDHYKRAMELDEKDTDARFNYEFVKKKLEELEKKMNEQKKEQNQQQNQKQNQQNQKQNQPQGPSGQSGEDKNQEDRNKQEKENQSGEQKNPSGGEEQQKNEGGQGEQQKDEQQKKEQRKQEQQSREQEKEEQQKAGREEQNEGDQGQEQPDRQRGNSGLQDSAGAQGEHTGRSGNMRQEGRMTEEEAERLLEGFRYEEEAFGGKEKKVNANVDTQVEKDW